MRVDDGMNKCTHGVTMDLIVYAIQQPMKKEYHGNKMMLIWGDIVVDRIEKIDSWIHHSFEYLT